MVLVINGEDHIFENDVSIRELLDMLGVKRSRVAVELNRKIVGKGEYDTTFPRNGDVIEIVQFVGGG